MSSSSDYRKRTQRKGMATTIIAGVVIVGAVIAIIVAIIALSSKDNTKNTATPSDATAAQSDATADATQPTLYRGELPTITNPTSPASTSTGSTPTTAPTIAPTTAPTQAPADTPIDPGAVETPAENPDNSGTGRIRNEAPLNTYTDDSGVLHIITPAGYNWTYQYDGSHVSITCDPQGDRYEFLVTGVAPGSEEVTPQYFVREDKTAWVAVPVTVYVDENLRVTVAG